MNEAKVRAAAALYPWPEAAPRAAEASVPAQACGQAPPFVIRWRADAGVRAENRMDEGDRRCVQHQPLDTEMLTDEPVVVAAAVAGIAEDVVRDVVEVPADLAV
ncbi:hypothetical protein, partial [Dokdonella sp.]|uniref:hypothetical protein n=1 Tax=Dokdonella sp. TaxID=2291710 RepID=UPI0031C2F037|nr:hypothetical protein [Dokdonella sp.]